MRYLGFVLCLAVTMTACGDTPTAPTSQAQPPGPTQVVATSGGPPSPIPTSLRVSGDAYDTASQRIAGARVEVLDGPLAGTSTTTDDLGHFSIAGSFDDSIRFRVSKPGYFTKTQTSRLPGCAMCNRYLGFLMELEAPPVDLTGNYTLTLAAASSCAGIPEEARTRTYDAIITRDQALRGSFTVAIAGGSILHGHASEFINFGVAGSDVTFSVGDLHGSSGLVEQLTADTYIGFDGSAHGVVAPHFSNLSWPFDGLVDYCRLPPGSPRPVGGDNYYTCTSGRVACKSTSHLFTLSRR